MEKNKKVLLEKVQCDLPKGQWLEDNWSNLDHGIARISKGFLYFSSFRALQKKEH